jgi:WD40 repeat protein
VGVVAFSPDGKVILTGSGDPFLLTGEIRLWDADTATPRGKPLALRLPVLTAAFSPDGKLFATGLGQPPQGAGEVWLWDLKEGKWVGKPWPQRSAVPSLAFSPDGLTILTGSSNEGARFWSTTAAFLSGTLCRRQKGPSRPWRSAPTVVAS